MAFHIFVTGVILFTVFGVVSSITVLFSTVEEESPVINLGKISDKVNNSESKVLGGDLDSVTFSILAASDSTDYREYFNISSDSSFSLVKKVDRDAICPKVENCTMSVVVFANNLTVSEFIRVEVIVVDINDNVPTFIQESLTLNIAEGSPISSSYSLPSASDLDSGLFDIQQYVLSPSGTNFELNLHENPDGSTTLNLVLNLSLDRESWDSYQLRVEASDGGTPAYTGTLTVTINVTDINDNRPIFKLPEYNATIDEDSETNSAIVKVEATDRDIGENKRLIYYFADSVTDVVRRYFGIDEVQGLIYVKERLDSARGPFVFFVEAKDHGEPVKKNQVKVTINVRDKNDNKPQIQLSPSENIHVRENLIIGTHVALVLVTDEDKDLNGEVECECLNPNFKVVKQQGASRNTFSLVTGAVFDREIVDDYEVEINCSDKGVPSLSSNITFIVRIADDNDNSPVFTEALYTANVTENNSAGAVLLRVTASDHDIGVNGKITYQIEPFDDSFRFIIEANSGIIKASQPFDRETNDTFTFVVKATDNGVNREFTTALVTIFVQDENDNAPKFKGDSYAMSVVENANRSTGLGTITATDPDLGSNGKISYSIPVEYSSYPFTILDSGTVITTEVLDREDTALYEFEVVASDHGVTPLTSSIRVTVTVVDMNDNAPVIDFPYGDNNTVSVAHNTEPNTVIASILAYDDDDKDNKRLTYSIVSGNSDKLFKIDAETGHVFLTRQISTGDVKQFTLRVSVKDNGETPHETEGTLHVRFYVASGPEGSHGEKGSTGQNILIAIVISCITFVLSAIIIVIICIIKRKDSKKDLFNAKSYDEQKIIQGHRSSNRSSSSRGSQDKMLCVGEKPYMENGYVRRVKKEVSFSVDEELDTGISVAPCGSLDLVSTFKAPSPVPSKSQEYDSFNKEISPPRSEGSDDTKQREIHRITSLRVHQALIKSQNNNNKQWPQSPTDEEGYWTFPRRSMPGQGIIASSLKPDEQRSLNTSTSHPFYSTESRQPTFSSFHGNNVHNTGPILSSFVKQKQKRQQNEDLRKNSYPMNDLSNPHRNNLHNPYRQSGETNLPSPVSNINSEPVPNKLDFDPLLHSSKQSNLNYRHSFDDGSITNRSQDDDNTTTTSGSYTINDLHDDLHDSESKDMFYKPDTFV